MPAATRTSLRNPGGIPCPCGRWHWFELALDTGLAVLERGCPRCRRRTLLLLRCGQVVAVTPLLGRDLGSLRETLARTHGLSAPEREQIMAVARAVLGDAAGGGCAARGMALDS